LWDDKKYTTINQRTGGVAAAAESRESQIALIFAVDNPPLISHYFSFIPQIDFEIRRRGFYLSGCAGRSLENWRGRMETHRFVTTVADHTTNSI